MPQSERKVRILRALIRDEPGHLGKLAQTMLVGGREL